MADGAVALLADFSIGCRFRVRGSDCHRLGKDSISSEYSVRSPRSTTM